jgi:hypothetical protein
MLLSSCATSHSSPSAHASKTRSEPDTRKALLQIAARFNANYSSSRDGFVYDRWDSKSRAIISRGDYVRRHVECPTAPGPAIVEGATLSRYRFWQVRYSISGVQLVDFWHYVNGHWRFSLIRSNPNAVKLYELPFSAYASAVGCSP